MTSSQSYWLTDRSTSKIQNVAADDIAGLFNAAAGNNTSLLLGEIRQGDCGPHNRQAAPHNFSRKLSYGSRMAQQSVGICILRRAVQSLSLPNVQQLMS